MNRDKAEALLLEIALSQVKSQKEDLRHLRSQASISAVISGLIANFFVILLRALPSEALLLDPKFMGFPLDLCLGLSCLIASLCCSAMVVAQHVSFDFEVDPKWLVERIDSDNLEGFAKNLALDRDLDFDANEQRISKVQSLLWFAAVFAIAQIAPWSVFVVRNIGVG